MYSGADNTGIQTAGVFVDAHRGQARSHKGRISDGTKPGHLPAICRAFSGLEVAQLKKSLKAL